MIGLNMPENITETTEESSPLSLYDEPAKLVTYIKSRRKPADSNSPDKPQYNFSDFVSDMQMTNFEDSFEMRAMLESQAHLLGTAFQYLMMEGDFKNLTPILRMQKTMRDTMELMNHYPMLSWHHKQLVKENTQDASSVD